MAIDPEVIPPNSYQARRSKKYVPKWILYSASGLGVLFVISFLKALFPLMGMAFLLAFIWSQANKSVRN